MHPELDFAGGALGVSPAVGDGLQYAGELVAEEHADYGGGRFVGAETVVVARARHAYPEKVLMLVHRRDHGSHDEQELHVVRGALARLEDGCR